MYTMETKTKKERIRRYCFCLTISDLGELGEFRYIFTFDISIIYSNDSDYKMTCLSLLC
jgi:hypothetical protein